MQLDPDEDSAPQHTVPLSYMRPRRRYKPLVRQGIGSIINAVAFSCIGLGFLVGTIGALLAWLNWRGSEALGSGIVFAGIAIWALVAAAVCVTDAVVELGGREPPTWWWYRRLGRGRHRSR